jgi:hypothetical protein
MVRNPSRRNGAPRSGMIAIALDGVSAVMRESVTAEEEFTKARHGRDTMDGYGTIASRGAHRRGLIAHRAGIPTVPR